MQRRLRATSSAPSRVVGGVGAVSLWRAIASRRAVVGVSVSAVTGAP
jgi:hypothetical protein